MADITMTYSALETAAGNVNTAKSDLDSVISHLNSAFATLEGSWSGASYEAFRNAWQESKPTMERLAEAVAAFAPALNKAVEEQRIREAQAAGEMGKLSF